MTMKTLLAEASQCGATVAIAYLRPGLRGHYDEDRREILLDIRLTMPEMKEALAHELGHALYGHTCSTDSNERQAWRRAAELLVDLTDYVLAEAIDPDPQFIADELGLTRPGVRAYRCSGSSGHVARRAEPVEAFVSAVIVGRLRRDDARDLLVDRAESPDLEALRSERMAVQARLDSIALDFADGSLTSSQLRMATERLRARAAEIEVQTASAGRVDVLGPLIGIDDVRAAWDALGVPRQRAIVDLLVEVTIHPPGRGTRTFRPESVAIAWRS